MVLDSIKHVDRQPEGNLFHSRTSPGPSGASTPISSTGQLATCGLENFRQELISQGFSEEAALLIQNLDGKELEIITNINCHFPGESGIVGVVNKKLIHLVPVYIIFLIS